MPSKRSAGLSGFRQNLSKNLKKSTSVFKNKIPFENIVFACIGVNILLIILIFLLKKNILPPVVPLLYGLPEGENQLVESTYLVIPPAASLLFILFNSTFAYFLKDDFIKKTLVLAVLVATFFSSLTVIKITLLVGSI